MTQRERGDARYAIFQFTTVRIKQNRRYRQKKIKKTIRIVPLNREALHALGVRKFSFPLTTAFKPTL